MVARFFLDNAFVDDMPGRPGRLRARDLCRTRHRSAIAIASAASTLVLCEPLAA